MQAAMIFGRIYTSKAVKGLIIEQTKKRKLIYFIISFIF